MRNIPAAHKIRHIEPEDIHLDHIRRGDRILDPTGNSKLKESGLVPAQSDGSWRIAEVDQGDKPSSEVVVYE